MERFNAEDFLRRFDAGELDGRLGEELGKLSTGELEEISEMLAQSVLLEAKRAGLA
jgi:hypothetical protein